MPRLILRLAPLRDEAAGRTAEARRNGLGESAAQTASEGVTPSASQPADPHRNGRSAVVAAIAAELRRAALPSADEAATRRVVDVAGPERLTIATPLTRWGAAVAAAHDPCLVIDSNGVMISVSVAAVELLGWGDCPIVGRHILDLLRLVDLDSGAPDPDYAGRITALAVLDHPGLARSLMRVRHPDGSLVTLDTSSSPVHDATGYPLGSVTFLAPIRVVR